MIEVRFLGPLSHKANHSLSIKNLKELKQILNKDDDLKKWLGLCAISVNVEIAMDLEQILNDGDVVCILPPVCGG